MKEVVLEAGKFIAALELFTPPYFSNPCSAPALPPGRPCEETCIDPILDFREFIMSAKGSANFFSQRSGGIESRRVYL